MSNSIPKKASVVIIGGGPAGAYAATRLAQQNIDVVVLEKAQFPRYQVGESVIPHVWKFLDLIDLSERIEQAGFIKKGGGAVLWEGQLRAVYFSKHGYKRPGLHVEREIFDTILLERSVELGAMVFQNMTVTKVDLHTNNISFQHTVTKEQGTIHADYIVDASGQTALVSKQEGIRKWDKDFKFQAVWGYFDQSDYLNGEGEILDFSQRFTQNPMSLASSTGNWGWVWHLIMQNKVSVGAIIPQSDLGKFKAGGSTLKERYLSHIRQTPLTSSLLEKGKLIDVVRTVRDYAYEPKKLVIGNCYLAGDAASFADPINSEGVTMALYSGFLAADCILKSLEKTNRADFYQSYYEKTLRKRYKVFKVLSYPSKTLPKELIEGVKDVVRNQSTVESHMILDHLICTNRSTDYPELLESLGIPKKEFPQRLPLPISIAVS